MPGAFPHLVAGSAMFIIGRYFFKDYFSGNDKVKEQILLAVVCLSFSLLPDFFLVIYYTTHVLSFSTFVPYHNLSHLIFSPIAIIALLILKYWGKTKREPIWIMGLLSIVLHIIMDLFIPESGIWI